MLTPSTAQFATLLILSAFHCGTAAMGADNETFDSGYRLTLAEEVIKTPTTVTAIPAERVPGMPLAGEVTTNQACAMAVAGKQYAPYVRARLLTPQYYLYPVGTICAREKRDGKIQVLFAYTDVRTRSVLVLPPMVTPTAVLTRLFAGGAKRIDTIKDFESCHGFKNVTPEILRASIILHEAAHLNGTALDDGMCLVASMVNTRIIAEACFPEIIANAPAEMMHFGSPRALFVRLAKVGTAACSMCHLDRKKPFQKERTGM